MTLQGIDVSSNNGTFDWAPYRGKISFGFAKVSEGLDYADPTAARNIAQMRAEGIVPGGYHFLHADEDGAAQAEFFLSHAKTAGLAGGCLAAFDAEDGGLRGMSAARMAQVAADFTAQYRKHHPNWPAAYTEISMAPALVHSGSSPLWLANPSGMAVKAIGAWKGGPSFEQVSQDGVDRNVFYGTMAQLLALAIPK